jgi:hypothetical protein
MSLVATKDKYHVALDGIGFLLQGAPDRPAYLSRNAPVYGTRFASGDRDYNDLSQWWYFIQTDWSGGFKDSHSWEDDAKFYYSANIDAFSKVGALRLMRVPTSVNDFSESIRCGLQTSLNAGVLVTAWRNPSENTNPDNFNGTSFGSLGFGNWTNPTNAYSSNNSDATANQGGSKYQHYHGFGFSVPSSATIVGIEVRMEAKCTQGTGESGTQIFGAVGKTLNSTDAQNSAIGSGTSRSFPAQPSLLTGSDAVYTRGGAADLWNNTWTPAEINASTFGIQINGNRNSSPTTTNYAVDEIAIRVYYRLGAADNATYVGTGNESGQPIVYVLDGTWQDISTANYTNTNRTAFVHLAAPLGILNIHSMTAGSNANNVVAVWDGTTWTDITSFIAGTTGLSMTPNSSRCSATYGGANYIFVDNLDQGYGLVSHTIAIPTASSDFTHLFTNARSNEAPIAACEFEGSIYYLVAKSITNGTDYGGLELRQYDIANDVDVLVKDFKNVSGKCDRGCQGLLINTGSSLVITTPPSEIWEIKSGVLQRIFKMDEGKKFLGGAGGNPGEIFPSLLIGAVLADNKCWWGNLIYDPVQGYFYNGFKGIDDENTYDDNLIYPLFTDLNDDIFFVQEEDLSVLKKYDYDATSFKSGASNSAFLVFSNHDKLQSIDKLLHMVTLGFEPFEEGESISVYYSTLPTPSTAISDWTLLGTASHSADGASAVFKNLLFPTGTTAKKVWFRVQFASDGTSTPDLTDFTLEYLPIPDYKKQWELIANCADEVKNLAGRHLSSTARELRSQLEKAWLTKSQLDFQDLDYASTTLVDNPLSNSNTTITVASTDDFPERGRIKIDDEEIIYTGKTRTTFTGCIRGARGTKAVQHSQGAAVHNGYKVIVLGVESRTPVILEGKNLEYTFQLSLREV